MHRRKAFTYIELTIVAAIIGILAAIAIPNFLEARIRAGVSRSKAELAILKMAIEDYRMDHRAYPPNKQRGQAGYWDLVVLTTPVSYLSALPYDLFTTPEARGSRHPTPVERLPYQFFNAEQARPGEGLLVQEPLNQFSGYVAVLIWGIGPASSVPAQPAKSPTTVSPEGEAQLLAYDPTNGTTSKGDIYLRLP